MNDDLKIPKQSKVSLFLVGIIGAIIGGLIVGGAFLAFFTLNGSADTVVEGATQQIVVSDSNADSVVEAVAQVVPQSVVGIETTVTTMTVMGAAEGTSVGSGFILTSDGYIATNHHVVEGGSTITVSLDDGSTYEGDLIWSDSVLDMAIIKIDAKDLPVLELGDSDDISVGELAVAVGNPMGLNFERTVTSGIVSALNRSIPLDNGLAEDLIQTDASINEGNSGGPLVNKNGKVIGINTYKLSSGEGMGFAIPINILKPILNEIVATGTFTPTVIGITGYDRAIADYYLTDAGDDFDEGIYIASIQQGYGAAEAGLQQGDIILSIDGVETNTMLKMKEILYGKDPGESVTVTFLRNGSSQTAEVTVSAS
ncbi:trypsin-like peptidase domain-containing protein [Eubacteriaceae bacterium ES3]|nr:trypsin-like peptidase domain-containing protein [Eubacteriaceae bacterium ES3]